VDDPTSVSVGEFREAVGLVHADLAVVTRESGSVVFHTDAIPTAAWRVDRFTDLVDRLDRRVPLQHRNWLEEVSFDAVAYESEFAVVTYELKPYLVPAPTTLSTHVDVANLFRSGNAMLSGPDIRLPGPLPPVAPAKRVCFCPEGHRVVNPDGPACPEHDAVLIC
jgi:hypothetical protein